MLNSSEDIKSREKTAGRVMPQFCPLDATTDIKGSKFLDKPLKIRELQSTRGTEKHVFVNYKGHCHVRTEGTVVQLASATCERAVPYDRQRLCTEL